MQVSYHNFCTRSVYLEIRNLSRKNLVPSKPDRRGFSVVMKSNSGKGSSPCRTPVFIIKGFEISPIDKTFDFESVTVLFMSAS